MKNLSLATKMSILVVVFLATALTIAGVGVSALSRMYSSYEKTVNRTSKSIRLASECRAELLASVRAEKNAVIIQDKTKALELKKEAEMHLENAKKLRNEVATLVGANSATEEGTALAELERALEAFEKNQKEVLRLAVIKSIHDGELLLYGKFYRLAEDAEDFIASLAEPAPDDASPAPAAFGTQRAKQSAGQQMMGLYYDLLYHGALHLNSSDKNVMDRLDKEMRAKLLALGDSGRRFLATLNDAERSRGVDAVSPIMSIKTKLEEFQDFSHTNSGHYASDLTITETFKATNACNTAFAKLVTALSENLTADRGDAEVAKRVGTYIIIGSGIAGSLMSLAFAMLVIRSITRPVNRGLVVFEAIAAGDLTQRMNLNQHDEMGRLAAASDAMAARLHEVVSQTRTLAEHLGQSSTELSGVSHDLLSQSQEMATQAESVAAATEQMSSNISGMASAAEQMSSNVASISSASEEVSVNVASISASAAQTSRNVGVVADSISQITTSLKGVAHDAKEGSEMTQQAREMAANANQAMRQLGQAANEINKVTDVIKSIALQTNLLALNATIEATSAGEAGKGFAVVAGEVKELASQSGQSAEEIARKIEGVQASTREAVKIIEGVAQFIERLNVSAARIHDAVDLQTQATNQISTEVASARKGVEEIARSIAEVAKGATDVSGSTSEVSQAATDVSRNAAEAAEAARSISPNIHGVSEATRHNNAAATKVNEAAQRCKEISSELQKAVSHFKLGTQGAA